MPVRRSSSRGLVAVATTAALTAGVLGTPSQAAPVRGPAGRSASDAGDLTTGRSGPALERAGFYDARQVGVRAELRADRQRLRGASGDTGSYLESLGPEALVDYDPLTRTVRNLGRRDGYLTGPASGPARRIALAFVRANLEALGLTSADLSTLVAARQYVDPLGVRHLSWTQSVRGVPVFGNGLKVNVARDGRVLSVQGAPVPGLAAKASEASMASSLDAGEARSRAAADVGGAVTGGRVTERKAGATRATTWSNRDYAKRVWFLTPSGLRLGWSTYVQSGGDRSYQHVLDAETGQVLFRRSTVDFAKGDARVYDYYPGAERGGKAKVVNLYERGYLRRDRTWLKGTSVVAWADVKDDDFASRSEQTPVPGTKRKAQFKLTRFGTRASSRCKKYVCTWDPGVRESWRANMKADVTQAFYLASNFQGYLEKPPIGFDKAAGNFTWGGGDPVWLNTLDGANTRNGMPDAAHVDNANMSTPPDGRPPRMQMYLWHQPGVGDKKSPYVPTSSGFDAATLYHEYTHGLSNRLVIDAGGNSTLNSLQAGAMGEAWSDYYALDYITKKGWVQDTAKPGEVKDAEYLTAGGVLRTEALDCPVDATTGKYCQDKSGQYGGYTYGDLADIGENGAQVHTSAEIWTQTLWDMRRALGHKVTANLVTRAMSLSPADPSFLDMRNAVLQADMVAYPGEASHTARLWEIFAARGMGYYAGSADGADVAPGEDFETLPPDGTPKDTLTGTVTDPTTGQPVEGALVKVTGLGDAATAVTDASGEYFIDELYRGTYQKVAASAPGYESTANPVTTNTGDADFEIRRDWAASSGGGVITDFNGPDYTEFGCGPDAAIDTSQATGWGSTTGRANGAPTNEFRPKFILVDLQQTVDITGFAVDPSNTCLDAGSSSTGDYRIKTSPDGQTWTTAREGTFTGADRQRLNDVPVDAAGDGVRYVKFQILGNQTPDFENNCPDGPFDGCSYTDLTEFMVFGTDAAG